MDSVPEGFRRLLGLSTTDPKRAAEEILRRLLGFSTADPTGVADQVSRWVPRYREAAAKRHGEFISAWKSGYPDQALVELHFFLISVSRIVAFMKMAADRLGGDVKAHVDSRDFAPQKQARDHFEHIEDRLYGGQRSRVLPITEGGSERTVHFGLRSTDQHFTFSDKAIDTSENFLRDFLSFVTRFEALVEEAVDAGVKKAQARASPPPASPN